MILKDYVSPEVEIIEVAVEKGYAMSINPDDVEEAG